MMKNWMRMLALALCLMFVCPSVIAEQAYKPGMLLDQMMLDAIEGGKMVTGTVKMGLELDKEMFTAEGMTEQELDALLDVLARSEMTFGAGRIDGGVRFEIGAEMAAMDGATPATVDAAINVTRDGVALELIEGKCVNAKWETLMSLVGVEQTYIDMFTAYKDADLNAMVNEVMAQVEPLMSLMAGYVTPYLETIVDFAGSLPMGSEENLAEEGYPVTAKEVSVTITAKDVGALINRLCDQLEQDSAMTRLINNLFVQVGEEMDAATLIAAGRAAAQTMTDTSVPLVLYLGMDEAGMPLYVEMFITDEASDSTIYGGLFCYESEEDGWVAEAMFGVYEGEMPIATAYMGGTFNHDPADENVFAAEVLMNICEGETPLMEIQFLLGSDKAEPTEAELAVYDIYEGCSMNVDGMQMVASTSARSSMTATGGERVTSSSVMDLYLGEEPMTSTAYVEMDIEPTADGGFTGSYHVNQSGSYTGIENVAMDVSFATKTYDPAATAALEQIDLETATNDEMNALLAELEALLGQKIGELENVIPADVMQMIAE